ncbi:MAG: glycosyltransferase family 2 protein [Angustibacter sp.]
MGDRPRELTRAVRSLCVQTNPPRSILVIGNGAAPCFAEPPPHLVKTIELPENIGLVAARDLGWRELTEELIFFLDDDAWLLDDDALDRIARAFEDPRLGICTLRILDPETGLTARRHVPRLRAADPGRPGAVTTFLGGVSILRRRVLSEVGGFPGQFWYAHEETDVAWAALDRGWSIHYLADVCTGHPTTSPARHSRFYQLNARNRVWLARRRLPWPLALLYLANWTVLSIVRVRSKMALSAWLVGFYDGWRTDPGDRRAIGWRTVARMTRLGRPPIL